MITYGHKVQVGHVQLKIVYKEGYEGQGMEAQVMSKCCASKNQAKNKINYTKYCNLRLACLTM